MKGLFRLSSAIALAAMMATTAIPVFTGPAQAATLSGGFDVGPGGFQGNFNPLAATGGFTWLSVYFEPLVTYDEKLEKVVGQLASSYEVSPDQMTYTFKLADAKWHDGKPFTAKDAKFTIELAKNAKTGSVLAARLNAVSSADAKDDKTLVIKLSAPSASLMDTLTKVMMLPEHALSQIPADQLAKNSWWSTTPIGTGPFKFSKYVTDQYVELAANTDYRGGKPALEKIINRYFANPAAAIAALRAGEIQFTYVDSNDLKAFNDNKDFRVIEGNSFVVNYLGFNHDSPIWKDVRVRQAVMYAINRDAIIQSLYGGAAKPANCGYIADQLVPKGIEAYSYDPEKARQLLKEAGWDEINGDKPITLLTYYTTPLAANVMAAVQAMLAQVASTSRRAPSTRRPITVSCSTRARCRAIPDGLCRPAERPGSGQHQCRPQRKADSTGRPERRARAHAGADRRSRCGPWRDGCRQARRPLPGGLQSNEQGTALGSALGSETLRRRLRQAQGLHLDACPRRRSVPGAPGKMGDRRIGRATHPEKPRAAS